MWGADQPPRRTVVRVPAYPAASGEIIAGPGDLAARVAGTEAAVVGLAGPSSDLLLLLVWDMVGDLALVEPARAALTARLEALPSNAWAGLLSAQDGLRVVLDPAPDRAPLLDAVQGMPVSGKAGLLDTIEQAALVGDAVLRRSRARAAVLYVTDSDVYNYREDFANPVINSSDRGDLSRRFPEALIQEKIKRLSEQLAARETPVYILHLRYRTDRLNEAYQVGLQQLASLAGGASRFCRTVTEIPSALEETMDAILGHYSVSVRLPARLPASFEVKIERRAGGGALTHRARFRTP